MNVILLAPTPPPQGGIANWTKRMMKARLKNGWHVIVVDEKTENRTDAYGKASNLKEEAKRCIRIWTGLINALKDKESQIVQACIPARNTSMIREYIAARITKAKKRKFIVHFRCTLPNMVKSNLSLIIFKMLVNLSDCVFVLNSASADFVKKNAPRNPYVLIPNFIETNSIKVKEHINIKFERLTYVGGVNKEKGCDFIASIAKAIPDKEFVLIGHVGMDTSDFPDNVKLLGEMPNEFVCEALENTDAFIFLTRYSGEGFSNALAEAMAHSLPCIVSDWAANADMIEDQGGIVLKEYKLEDALEALERMESVEERAAMGDWNRRKVLTAYSDKVITELYVDAYEELVR